MQFFLVFFILDSDMLLKFRKLDDDFIFSGKLTDFCHNMQGINQIHAKNAVEKSDHETEPDMIREPKKPFKNLRMN